MILNKLRLDLVSIINAAIDSVQPTADAKSIQIVAQLTPTISVGDMERLHQVMCNLLSNAIKFTPTGGRIEISVAPTSDRAEIRVSDTGIGISPELLPHIFDRFRQGDTGTSKTSQGLGLGLAIVRQIVELHGGTVRAESPGVGHGTTIVIQLPGQLPADLPATSIDLTAALPALPGVTQELPSLAGLQILSVDDDPDLLELMKYILESVGAQVTIVFCAEAAIAALTTDPDKYAVLLLDLGMPEQDGFALIEQVRALERGSAPQIPAIAITAYVGDLQRRLALDAGCQLHLTKPIDPTQLIRAIASLTGRLGDPGG
jgi:two-component system CheB/CheR fusion protein